MTRAEFFDGDAVVRVFDERAADSREDFRCGHRQVIRQADERSQFVEDQLHHAAGGAFLVVLHRQLGCAQDQLAQERRDRESHAALRHGFRRLGRDVERPELDLARSEDAVFDARRQPHGALRRHDPGLGDGAAGVHGHDALRPIDELEARVTVPRDLVVRGQVARHRGHRAGHSLVVVAAGTASGWSRGTVGVSHTQQKLSDSRVTDAMPQRSLAL